MTRSGTFTHARRMAVLAAGLVVLPAAAHAQSRENIEAVHAFLSAVDLGEVQMSRLAFQRATNPEVRDYAALMIVDHGNALFGREAFLEQQGRGLLPAGRLAFADFAPGQGPFPPLYQPGSGNTVVVESAFREGNVTVYEIDVAYQRARAWVAAGDPLAIAVLNMPVVVALDSALMLNPVSRPIVEVNARNLNVLEGLTGAQFDATYMDAQIAGHQYALTNLDRMIAQGGMTNEVMTTMQNARVIVAAHLDAAQAIRGRLP